MVEAYGLRLQEAALTGESVPVDKSGKDVLQVKTPLAERNNFVFMGTTTLAGKASAVVHATGMDTELGRIVGLFAAARHRTDAPSAPFVRTGAPSYRFLFSNRFRHCRFAPSARQRL